MSEIVISTNKEFDKLATLLQLKEHMIGDYSVQAVDGRALHEALEAKNKYRFWAIDQIDKVGLVENVDFSRAWVETDTLGGVQQTVNHIFTIVAAKKIALNFNGKRKNDVLNYFFECEKVAQESIQEKVNSSTPNSALDRDIEGAKLFLSLLAGNVSEDYYTAQSIKMSRVIDAKHGSNLTQALPQLEVAKVTTPVQDPTKPAHMLDCAIGSVEYSTSEICKALNISNSAFYDACVELKILIRYKKIGNRGNSGHIICSGYEKLVRQQPLNDSSVKVIKGFYFNQFDDDLKKKIVSTAQKYMKIVFNVKK